jgi:CheY-like chemotaxis protein
MYQDEKCRRFIRILLVEDDAIAAKVAQSQLVSLGCSVDIAPNGKLALKQVIQHEYTFVLVDIGLPDMTGIDVAKSIRAWKKHLPIIGLTAHVEKEKEVACLHAGMQKVLPKPLSVETALNILAMFVHG